jgi:hypothetical protein
MPRATRAVSRLRQKVKRGAARYRGRKYGAGWRDWISSPFSVAGRAAKAVLASPVHLARAAWNRPKTALAAAAATAGLGYYLYNNPEKLAQGWQAFERLSPRAAANLRALGGYAPSYANEGYLAGLARKAGEAWYGAPVYGGITGRLQQLSPYAKYLAGLSGSASVADVVGRSRSKSRARAAAQQQQMLAAEMLAQQQAAQQELYARQGADLMRRLSAATRRRR